MKRIITAFLFLLASFFAPAQSPRVEMLSSGTKTSLRGLSAVNDSVIWVSGSSGTVGRSTDGGRSWKWTIVKGFEKTEFRDIEAFDAGTAVIMGIAEPAYLLRTTDGGENWKIVYENKTKGMFLDAMDFANDRQGIVIGDPLDGKVFIACTGDGGNTWSEVAGYNRPAAADGEAFFAASGTNVRFFDNGRYYIVSGGLRSRLFISPVQIIGLPVIQGRETTGANSIDIFSRRRPGRAGRRMVIVGGDFNADSSSRKNCFYSRNGGRKWKAPSTPPHGYRSCVAFLSAKRLVACGLTGIDYSANGGKSWQWISRESFHVCRKARTGTTVFLAGSNGRIAKMVWE